MLDCPGRRPSKLVRLQVELVECRVPGGGYHPVDLHGYLLAQPDWILALGVQVQEHLNAVHREDVLEAACALARQRTGQVVSAQQDWIHGYGFEESMIDESGGRQLRYDFPSPVFDPRGLSTAVHESLARAAATRQRPAGEGCVLADPEHVR